MFDGKHEENLCIREKLLHLHHSHKVTKGMKNKTVYMYSSVRLNKTLHVVPKKRRRRVAWSSMFCGGRPCNSMMQANCSTSFSPGNRG